MNWIKDKGKI